MSRKQTINSLLNPDVKAADNKFTPDSYDNYINMELKLDRGGDRTEFARVKKTMKDANRIPIGVANDNPILYSRMYEVKYCDGYVATLASNGIADNVFTQVDKEGNIFVLTKSIIDTRTNSKQTLYKDAFVITNNGTK